MFTIIMCFYILQVESSPFTERLIKKGYEVLYLTEPVDEYTIQSLPEYEGKKFQNVAKEGLKIGEESEKAKERRTNAVDARENEIRRLKDQLSSTTTREKTSTQVRMDL